jgi:hypothetical protein
LVCWGRGFESRSVHGCLSVVSICCVVLCRWRPLRRADHSSRGVLPCVGVCVCVCDQETLKREAKGPSWTISACENSLTAQNFLWSITFLTASSLSWLTSWNPNYCVHKNPNWAPFWASWDQSAP